MEKYGQGVRSENREGFLWCLAPWERHQYPNPILLQDQPCSPEWKENSKPAKNQDSAPLIKGPVHEIFWNAW